MFRKMIAIFLVMGGFCAYGQKDSLSFLPYDYSDYHDYHNLGLFADNATFLQTNHSASCFGMRLDLNTGHRVGFYYKLGMGVNHEGKLYGHLPIGLGVGSIIAAYAISVPDGYYLLLPALICTVIPEGMTICFMKRNNFNLKTYLSPWGTEINISKEHLILISGEIGVQGTLLHKKNFFVSPYIGTKVLYKHFQPAVNVGIHMGILLDN